MKKERTFAQEAKAMEFTIESLYKEREYLEKRVEETDSERDRIRLQMVYHFISVYEGY